MKSIALIATVVGLNGVGCAHVQTSEKSGDTRNGAPRSVAEVIERGDRGPAPKSSMTDYGEIVVQGIKLKNTRFDYPVTVNSRVEHWVDYFTGRGRVYFEKYLERSEFFIPYIAPILKANGMPEDLVYLAMIESGFNNFARSHAKAVGPWQFISATGKRYGLMVNWWVDERRDIQKSTLAAVDYLKDLYGMFQSWELAAAAYNAGEAKVARGIQRYGNKDFWVISRHRFLRQETRDYVPKIIAAALIAKNREQFGFKRSEKHPGADEAVAGDGELVKVIKTEKPEEKLDRAEEELQNIGEVVQAESAASEEESDALEETDGPGRITPATLMVPAESTVAPDQLAQSEGGPLAKPVPTPHVTKDGEVGGEELVEFEIKSPADLLKIARAAGLSYQTVKSLNPELLRWCTPPTLSTFRIRLPASTKDRFLTAYNHSAFPRQVTFMTYKVRRGETISHIARHFGIHADPIADLNRVSTRAPLRSGTQVILPIPNDRTRSLASLDVKDPPIKRLRSKKRQKFYKVSFKRREAARPSKAGRRDG